MLTDTRRSPFAKVSPLPGLATEWTAGFWKDCALMCKEGMVPQLKRMFDSSDISHVVENFRICAGDSEGKHAGTPFGDGDFYKWMEAAMYMAVLYGDEELFGQLEDYIDLIGRAQQPDGYISTKQILGERLGNGVTRLGDVNDFEVYNFGHLFTAACLYKRLTGRDSFLAIAKKAAGYLEALYDSASKTGEVQTAVCPSHYMGLIELYRTTGDEEYKNLAKLAVDLRDSVTNGTDDNQDRTPLKQHEKIVGHAVRANYLYAGAADLYAEIGDPEYLSMLRRVWKSLVSSKLYITGGCGALYNGVSPYGNFWKDQKIHQAYGYEYQLPNITAYNETCGVIGGIMWAYRMFQLDPKAEYMDMIERMFLNAAMAGVSLDGKRFFYENMLRRTKELPYELAWPLSRTEYITSYCCPPNLARLLAQSVEYAYTVSDDTLWTGIYGNSRTKVKLDCGAEFTVNQCTAYPYDGSIRFTFDEVVKDVPWNLNLRIPAWAESGSICLSGQELKLEAGDFGSYRTIHVDSVNKTEIVLKLDMPVRLTAANAMVEETVNQAAVERGPLVYCLESPDVEVDTLDDLLISPAAEFELKEFIIDGRKMLALETELSCFNSNGSQKASLYHTIHYHGCRRVKTRLIPYFAWDNREFGEMRIWLPVAYDINSMV